MLTRDGLKRDVDRRIERVQDMMDEEGLEALIVVGKAAPGGMGAIRYLTHAHLWGGDGYVVLGLDDPDPWLQIWSAYQAVWSQNETTTDPERVESPEKIVERTTDLAKEYASDRGRIGMVNRDSLMSVGTYDQFADALSGYDVEEVTDEFNEIRQIKTPFELEAIYQNGTILDRAMDVFQEEAHIGARYWDVCAAVEEFIKSHGSFWGRTKLSLDQTPYTVPTAKDRRMQEDDVINFEIVYESPYGYWQEMTTVFSFGELPSDAREMLDGYLEAVEASASVAKVGNTFQDISDANDQTLEDLGFDVAGKHTPDCHSTGLDGADGPSSVGSPDFELKENMVLSFHPGTVLEDDHGFLISDNFLVTSEGAVRLSPHDASRYHMELEP